jgi:hypothetical protein
MSSHVRTPLQHETREPGWRPVGSSRDLLQFGTSGVSYPEDLARLYYWRRIFGEARGE